MYNLISNIFLGHEIRPCSNTQRIPPDPPSKNVCQKQESLIKSLLCRLQALSDATPPKSQIRPLFKIAITVEPIFNRPGVAGAVL